jgi:HAD superfamily hydrolase (TIGR01484 family)
MPSDLGSFAKRVQAVAVDLDGTIVYDGVVDVALGEAGRLLRAKQVPVMAITGRRPVDAASVVNELSLGPYTVCGNGAVILKGSEQVTVHTLGRDKVTKVVDEIRRVWPEVALGLEYVDSIWVESGLVDAFPLPCDAEVVDDISTVECDPTKLFVFHPQIGISDLRQITNSQQLAQTYSGGAWIELTNTLATKGEGLRRLSHLLGLQPSGVMAVGDDNNDISMLKATPLSATFAWSSESVRQAANLVLSSKEELARLLTMPALGRPLC